MLQRLNMIGAAKARVNESLQPDAACKALVRKWEGLELVVKPCPEGVPTGGYGHTGRDVTTGQHLTREMAESWLDADLREHAEAVKDAVKVPLTQRQLNALTSFSFNVGKGWLTGRGHQQASFVKMLNAGNYDCVPGQLLRFARGANSGKRYDGLYNRRVDEGLMWKGGGSVTPAEPPLPMPQIVKQETGAAPVGSRTIYGAVLAAFGVVLESAKALLDLLPDAASEAQHLVDPVRQFLGVAGFSLPSLGLYASVIGIIIVVERRWDAARQQKIG